MNLSHLLLAALIAVTGLSAQAQEKLTVVADEWPPFSGESLPNKGMSLDIISAVLTRAGYEIETAVVPWARIMDATQRGEFDIVGSLFKDADVARTMLYSDPFFLTDIRFVQKVGNSFEFKTLPELKPYTISVGDGFLYEAEFDRADYLNKVVVTTAQQAIRLVAFGRADLTLDSVEVIEYIIQDEDPSLREMVEFAPGVLASQGIHMAIRKSHPQSAKIIKDFNKTLDEMTADRSLEVLLSRHTGR